MFEGINSINFAERFTTDERCHEYLAAIKWDIDHRCAKCSHPKYFSGKQPYGRCCSKCHYDESATAHTLFHKLKFPMRKAFYIVFLVVTGKKCISTHELGRMLSLRQKTCWLFKHKVMEAMKSTGKDLLDGEVEVDEFFVGGSEEGKRGRGQGKKRQVVLAIKVDSYGIHRSYPKVVPRADAIELEAFFDTHISKSALVRTDKWKGYLPLKNDYRGIVQQKSEKGRDFPFMHRQIMMIKAWLRGIHHQCRHLQAYLDEFNYRFNHLRNMETIFNGLIVRMMEHLPTIYQKLNVT